MQQCQSNNPQNPVQVEMIRIIGGQFRGKKLQVPSGSQVRPSGDRVREALFSMLEHRIEWPELTVLDLFSGSGALGIEALSRGAKQAYFVESSRSHLIILKENLKACGIKADAAKVIWGHAVEWIRGFPDPGESCLIFIDPPFQEGLYEPVLSILASHRSVHVRSVLAVESPKSMEFQWPPEYTEIKRRVYGNVALQLLEKIGTGRKHPEKDLSLLDP